MDTRFKGEVARMAVMSRALEKGWVPSIPLVEQARYDVILDDGRQRHRVQIKYTDTHHANAENSYYVNLRRHNRGTVRYRMYTAAEVDAVIVYVAAHKTLCWFPPCVFDNTQGLLIRTKPAKNGQRKGCLFAEDFIW